MAQYHQKGGKADPTFRGGNPPTGEDIGDVKGPNLTPDVDVGGSELPLHGALITISEGGRWGDKTLADAAAVAAKRGLVLDEEHEIAADQLAAVFRRR
jgi:hypothetical protein